MSLRVAVAFFVLIALAAFTVSAAIDEHDQARAQSGRETVPASGGSSLWPDEDPLDCPVYPLVVREYEPDAASFPPAGLPDYSASALADPSAGACSCCIVLPDSSLPSETLIEEEWI